MNFTKAILFFFVLGWSLRVVAQAPKYSNEFLSIGVGARALGMSNAQVASVDDVTSGFWNPAGLTHIKCDLQVTAMHNELFAGIAKYDYLSIATKIDSARSFAFSIVRLSTDDIPNTLELIDASGNIHYDRVTAFAAADYAFYLSYAKKSKVEGLRYGGSVKIIHRILGDFGKAWGFGFDLGTQYEKGKWTFGVMGKDVTSTFNGWSYNTDEFADVFELTNNEIPKSSLEITLPKIILATAYKTKLSKKITVLTELDADMTFDGQRNVVISSNPISVDPHLGVEFGYNGFIFLRGGVMNIQSVKNISGGKSTIFQPNMGVGIKLGNFSIEYALSNIGSNETPYSNIFSLKLDIYKHKK